MCVKVHVHLKNKDVGLILEKCVIVEKIDSVHNKIGVEEKTHINL
jgi:hypothetical protein